MTSVDKPLLYKWPRQLSWLFFVLVFVALSGCKDASTAVLNRKVGRIFGTSYSIQFFAPKSIEIQPALDSIFGSVNALYSTYDSTSLVSRINRSEGSVYVPPTFLTFWKKTVEISRFTQGYFNPTLGYLINGYGFGPSKTTYDIAPDWSQHVGTEKIYIVGDSLKRLSDKLTLDFNAVAKGYALDLVAQYFDQLTLNNYLIEIGGEIRIKGKHIFNDKNWRIGIEKPVNKLSRELHQILSLPDVSMATSGNYRKYKNLPDGKRQVHIINPITGKSQESDILSASVFQRDCLTADALATAIMAMGYTRARRFIDQHKIPVYIIYLDDGEEKVWSSPMVKAWQNVN